MPGALTLRQAKAAHKARGGPAITDKQIRELQREIQLDRRAWAAKERDKNKAKAAQARAEGQKRTVAEKAEQQLGTQRRYDRFGHKSSQFHLGAFFTKASDLSHNNASTPKVKSTDLADSMSDDDLDGIDDETLLSALQAEDSVPISGTCHSLGDDRMTGVSTPKTTGVSGMHEHINWDDFLESGTQIARELSTTQSPPHTTQMSQQQEQQSRMSFGSSSSLGLTSQDLEVLDPTVAVSTVVDRMTTSSVDDCKLMPPPTVVLKRQPQPPEVDRCTTQAHSIDVHHGFSSTQLESLVDDEIMLTQI
ncbi:hypothetical protein AMS68_004089 [Peltaster fructicola]|uniref:Uncharacterized protein n=1 Tax=Peltaster fructicola TaxID=286661 RepID=A0A6H0XUY9_9PEZI|nr:hypothetical protein AMS68_004089 [Peltaster fructicola]